MLAKFVTADGCIGYRELPDSAGRTFYVPIVFFEPFNFKDASTKLAPDMYTLIREFEYYRDEYDEFHNKKLKVYKETRTK